MRVSQRRWGVRFAFGYSGPDAAALFVVRNTMRIVSVSGLCFTFLLVWAGGGCTSVPVHTPDRPDVALQFQKSVTLAAGRYTELMRSVENGNLDQAKEDMDWWIDQAIIELQLLEEDHPNGDWAAVQVDSHLRMSALYRSLAQFRRDHSRYHSVPLGAESLKRIETFVKKYQ